MKNFQDSEKTSLLDGRTNKDSIRIEVIGTTDELNSFVGLAIEETDDSEIKDYLFLIQKKLFIIGAEIANSNDINKIKGSDVSELEDIILNSEKELEPLKNFVLPSGSKVYSLLHICRSVCRRLERRIVSLKSTEPINEECFRYVNRLSDVFFTLARLFHSRKGLDEKIWRP